MTAPPPSSAHPPRRGRKNARKLCDVAARSVTGALRRKGFADGMIVRHWVDIVGAGVARLCLPERLWFPPGQREGGTLYVVADGPAATDLSYAQTVVLERVNRYFGWAAVTQLRVRRGVVPSPPPPLVKMPTVPDMPLSVALEETLAQVQDKALGQVMRRLAVLATRHQGPL